MTIEETPLPGVRLLRPRVHRDSRGHFVETWQAERYSAAGMPAIFLQDNLSRSRRGTLRGLHYQVGQPQAKLVWVARGAVFDAVVDLRRASPTFGRWYGTVLSDQDYAQLFVPEGFAHGFYVLSDEADFAYMVSAPYFAPGDRCLAWNDPTVGVAWPLAGPPLLSPKDAAAPRLTDAEVFP